MDSNDFRPLSEEELAAVDKAMAEFANTPQKKIKIAKKPTSHIPIVRVPPLIRNILIAAVLVGLMVLLLLFILWPPTEAPSGMTPATSLPTEIYTDATEEPTEFPIPPDTQPTEMPTEPVVPPMLPPETIPTTELPTAPTEPPVVVPEGTPLSNDEIAYLQKMFHPGSVYASVSSITFTDPTTIKFQALVAADRRPYYPYKPNDEELAYLGSIYEGFLYMDICSIPRSEAIATLNKYYGLTLEDVPSSKNATYWDQTDRFYFIAEANGPTLTITHAVTLPGGNIWVRYINAHNGNVGTMVLSQAREYHILSNMIMNNVVTYPLQ